MKRKNEFLKLFKKKFEEWLRQEKEDDMEKNPKLCDHSIGFDGIYVCTLNHIPCSKVEKCPEYIKEEANEPGSEVGQG